MKAGELRQRLTLQYSTLVNTYGEIATTWNTYATIWVKIEPISGREYFESAQLNKEVTHRIKMRYKTGVKPQMRGMYGTRIFLIVSVLNIDEKEIEQHLMCEELIV